jgi:antirestriction protein ArdC
LSSTAHEKRLNRDLKNRCGTKAYAAEELIAELTAAFLCAHLEIEGELRHAGYRARTRKGRQRWRSPS